MTRLPISVYTRISQNGLTKPLRSSCTLHCCVQGKATACIGTWTWKHFPGRHPDNFKKQSILERADAARPDFEYVQLADGRLVAVNAEGEYACLPRQALPFLLTRPGIWARAAQASMYCPGLLANLFTLMLCRPLQ